MPAASNVNPQLNVRIGSCVPDMTTSLFGCVENIGGDPCTSFDSTDACNNAPTWDGNDLCDSQYQPDLDYTTDCCNRLCKRVKLPNMNYK